MGVCVVENLSRIFLSKWLLILLRVMRVYIVRVKGKKVTHLKSSRRRVSWVGPSLETLAKLIAKHDSLTSNMYFSRGSFVGRLLARHLLNPLIHPILTRFFNNLILNPIQ